ncbi:MAG: hypothetical protein P8183_14120, partial [Anaerolineae bacterium]
MKYVDPIHLRQVLKQYYSEGEIRTMCFDLGIEYESVPGRGKSERVDEAPPNIVSQQGSQQVTNVYVGGDYVGGDKIGGDKVGGDKVSGGKTEAGRDVIMTGGGDYAGRDMTKQSAGGDLYSAGGDININANPQDKAEFFQTLNAVKKLLEEAIANGEFEDDRDGEVALKEMQVRAEDT